MPLKQQQHEDAFLGRSDWIIAALLLVLFLSLRLITWSNTVLLADTDSMSYLRGIEAFHSLDTQRINAMRASQTPFYVASGAVVKTLVGNTETAAKLVSLLSGIVLLIAAALLACRWGGRLAALLTALFVVANPPLIFLSVAVLTELSYFATVYLGLYLLWRVLEQGSLSVGSAIGLAVVFGLAFLNRTEGLLFLAAVPVGVVASNLARRSDHGRVESLRLLAWSGAFVAVFLAMAIPQVLHVSSKMGAFAVNGRIGWMTLYSAMQGREMEAIVFGLDFSNIQTNAAYIETDFRDAVAQLGAGEPTSISNRLSRVVRNIDHVYRNLVGEFITPFGFAAAMGGLLALVVTRKALAFVFVLIAAGVLLAGPLLQLNVFDRHFFAVIPLICVLQGIGVDYVARLLSQSDYKLLGSRTIVAMILAGIVLAGQVIPMNNTLHPPRQNGEYDPEFLRLPMAELHANEDITKVSAQRPYIGFLSGTDFLFAPYASYDELLCYLVLNEVDAFYVDFKRMNGYPYLNRFSAGALDGDFVELWVSPDGAARHAKLYRVTADPDCPAPSRAE